MNYVRESVAAGVPVTEASLVDGTDKAWMDDKYLIPFMENDSLLFELDGALGLDAESGDAEDPPAQSDSESTRVRALEEENEALRRAVQEKSMLSMEVKLALLEFVQMGTGLLMAKCTW